MNGKARRAIGKTATYVTLVIIILVLNLPFFEYARYSAEAVKGCHDGRAVPV